MVKFKNNSLPDRWLDYKPVGSVIPGTRFAACKVPLREAMLNKVSQNERFGAEELIQAFPKMGLLVDLTYTTRYYDPRVFIEKNIKFEKLGCPGQVIPPPSIVKRFHELVNSFFKSDEDPDSIIVVHCTHGLNRTGYFICSYMIQQMNFQPEEAMNLFNAARGHPMERENYTDDLKNGCNGGSEKHLKKYLNWHFRTGKKETKKTNMRSEERLTNMRYDNCGKSNASSVGNSQRDVNSQRPAKDANSSQRPKPKNSVARNEKRGKDEAPGQWRRDQEEFRQQQQQTKQTNENNYKRRFKTFYEQPSQPPINYQPVPQNSYTGWSSLHESRSYLPRNFQHRQYDTPDNDHASESSGDVEAQFTWTPYDYNNLPPPPTGSYNQTPSHFLATPPPGQFIKMYSPGGSEPHTTPSTYNQRGKRYSRGRGNSSYTGQRRY